MFDTLYRNVNIATMAGAGEPYGAIRNGAIGVRGDRLTYVGPADALPDAAAKETVDLGGLWALPGLIDCHTHIVFGGNRANEFEMRLNGATYEEIAAAGGGILSTVKATRAATDIALAESAARRMKLLAAEGVMTIEVKSGYGLTLEDELKMLTAARAAGAEAGVQVVTTFLGAHALPPEYRDNRAGYISELCDVMIPAVAKSGLADAIDAFCEGIGFTPDEVAQVFEAATKHGLKVKLHADQLSDLGGGALAARFGALSADHLEYASAESIKAMAATGTVAVLLPGAYYSLHEKKRPPIEMMRQTGVPMALATDMNPGTSPVLSLLLMVNMGCTLFGLTPEEALMGITINAARGGGRAPEKGTQEAGKRADIVLFDIESPAELAYYIGGQKPVRIIRA